MEDFAALLERLLLTPSRNEKLTLLQAYFADQPDPERGWALAVIAGELELPRVKPGLVRRLVEDKVDAELFRLSYDYVGDLAETVSLIWPVQHGTNHRLCLSDMVLGLIRATPQQAERQIENALNGLDSRGRWALLKLVTGGLRIGVSARLVKRALADFGQVDISDIETIWHGLEPPYFSLFAWLEGKADKPEPEIKAPFRPVMLAHPLFGRNSETEAAQKDKIRLCEYAAEWKYDGIRIQAVAEQACRRLYTRTGDDISHSFPDIVESLPNDVALDGELLIRAADGSVAPFNSLQKRLNRKRVSAKLVRQLPAFIRVYDLLQLGDEDLRPLPFRQRRERLEHFFGSVRSDRMDMSPLLPVTDLAGLNAARNAPPAPEIEGLMLKRWDSVYQAGRPKGPWYKWKRDPRFVDVVLMYAQRGHGRRSGYYSDYTFGVWQKHQGEAQLTPVGKAYSGFTDAELKRLDKFVRSHTVERYGPVLAVQADQQTGLVLEVAFEGLQRSKRHKSGLAMRFPRIHRIRWDKCPGDADWLGTLQAFLPDTDEL